MLTTAVETLAGGFVDKFGMRRRYASLPTIFLIATFWLKVVGRPLLLFHGIYHMESRHAQMIIVEGFSFLTLQRLRYPHRELTSTPKV